MGNFLRNRRMIWESRAEISTSAVEWSRWCAGGERQQAAARSCMETVPAYGFYLLGPHKFWFLFLKQYTLSQFIWVPFICLLFTWPNFKWYIIDGNSCSDPRTKWLKDAKFTLYIALHFAEVVMGKWNKEFFTFERNLDHIKKKCHFHLLKSLS